MPARPFFGWGNKDQMAYENAEGHIASKGDNQAWKLGGLVPAS